MTTITELAERYDNFIFDCDGVVWQAGVQIGTAFETIEELERMGKKCIFLTNNATKLPADYGNKMAGMGYRNSKNTHIYTSAATAGKYLKRKYPDVRKAFVIGERSLRDSIEAEGVEVIGAE